MKFLSKEKISNRRYKTPEGYLVCLDAIIARTGSQDYAKSEIFRDSDDNTIVKLYRPEKEVFSPQTMASFENKPFVDEHPDEDVNVDNHREYAIGFVRDVRRATINGEDVLIANLVVTDAEAIAEIESGEKVELSCGYDCDILGEEPNLYQANIRGNHVALCKVGRAGIARIQDSKIKDGYGTSRAYEMYLQRLERFKNDKEALEYDLKDLMRTKVLPKDEVEDLIKKYKYKISKLQDSKIKDGKGKELVTLNEVLKEGEELAKNLPQDKYAKKTREKFLTYVYYTYVRELKPVPVDGKINRNEDLNEYRLETKYLNSSLNGKLSSFFAQEVRIETNAPFNWRKKSIDLIDSMFRKKYKLKDSITDSKWFLVYGEESGYMKEFKTLSEAKKFIKETQRFDKQEGIEDKYYIEVEVHDSLKDSKYSDLLKDLSPEERLDKIDELIADEEEAIVGYKEAMKYANEADKSIYAHIIAEELEHITELKTLRAEKFDKNDILDSGTTRRMFRESELGDEDSWFGTTDWGTSNIKKLKEEKDYMKDSKINYKGYNIEEVTKLSDKTKRYQFSTFDGDVLTFKSMEEAKSYIDKNLTDSEEIVDNENVEVEDKLIAVEESYINELKRDVQKIGFKIVSVKKYLGGEVHFQILSNKGDMDNSDLKYYAEQLGRIDDKFERYKIPMTFNIGLQYDGYISAGIDLRQQWIKDSIKDTHFTVSSNRNSEEFNSEEELLKKYKLEGYDTVRGIKAPKLKGLMGPFFNGNGKILYETKERYNSYDSYKDVDTYKEVTQELKKETKKLDSAKLIKLINIAKKAKGIKDSDKLKQLAYKFAQMGNYFDRANSSNSRNILAREDETKRAEFYKLGLEVYNQLKQEVDYLKNNKKSNSNRNYGFLTETVLLLEDGNEGLSWIKDEKCRLLSKKIDILLYEYKKYTYRDSKAKDSKIKDRDFIIEKVIKSAKDSKGQKFYIVLGKFSDKNEKSYLVTSENPNDKYFVGAGTVEKSLNEAEKTLQMYTKDSCKR